MIRESPYGSVTSHYGRCGAATTADGERAKPARGAGCENRQKRVEVPRRLVAARGGKAEGSALNLRPTS